MGMSNSNIIENIKKSIKKNMKNKSIITIDRPTILKIAKELNK